MSPLTSQHVCLSIIYTIENAKKCTYNATNVLDNNRGIQYTSNTSHQPREKSVAERLNQTVVSAIWAALHPFRLPHSFCKDTVMDGIFKYTLTFYSLTEKTPSQSR